MRSQLDACWHRKGAAAPLCCGRCRGMVEALQWARVGPTPGALRGTPASTMRSQGSSGSTTGNDHSASLGWAVLALAGFAALWKAPHKTVAAVVSGPVTIAKSFLFIVLAVDAVLIAQPWLVGLSKRHAPGFHASLSKRVVQFVRYQLRLSDAETPELAVAADEADGRRGGSAPSADVAEAVASALSDPKGPLRDLVKRWAEEARAAGPSDWRDMPTPMMPARGAAPTPAAVPAGLTRAQVERIVDHHMERCLLSDRSELRALRTQYMEEVRVDAERKWEGIRSQADPLIAQMTALAQDTRVLHADLREQWDDFSKSEVEARNAWVAETQTRMQEMRDAMKAQLGALREEAFRRMDADRDAAQREVSDVDRWLTSSLEDAQKDLQALAARAEAQAGELERATAELRQDLAGQMATVASKEELESARDEAMRAAQEGLAALREDAEAAILREREDLMSQIEAINQEHPQMIQQAERDLVGQIQRLRESMALRPERSDRASAPPTSTPAADIGAAAAVTEATAALSSIRAATAEAAAATGAEHVAETAARLAGASRHLQAAQAGSRALSRASSLARGAATEESGSRGGADVLEGLGATLDTLLRRVADEGAGSELASMARARVAAEAGTVRAQARALGAALARQASEGTAEHPNTVVDKIPKQGTGVEAEVARLSRVVASWAPRLSEMEVLGRRVEEVRGAVAAVQRGLAQAVADATDLEDRMGLLEQRCEQMSSENSSVEAELGRMDEETDSVEREVKRVGDALASVQDTLARAVGRLAKLEERASGGAGAEDVAVLQQAVEAHQALLDAHQRSAEEYAGRVEALEGRVVAAEASARALEGLGPRVEALEGWRGEGGAGGDAHAAGGDEGSGARQAGFETWQQLAERLRELEVRVQEVAGGDGDKKGASPVTELCEVVGEAREALAGVEERLRRAEEELGRRVSVAEVEGLRAEVGRHGKDMEGLRDAVGKQAAEAEALRGELSKQATRMGALEEGLAAKAVRAEVREELRGAIRTVRERQEEIAASVEGFKETAQGRIDLMERGLEAVEAAGAEVRRAAEAAAARAEAVEAAVEDVTRRLEGADGNAARAGLEKRVGAAEGAAAEAQTMARNALTEARAAVEGVARELRGEVERARESARKGGAEAVAEVARKCTALDALVAEQGRRLEGVERSLRDAVDLLSETSQVAHGQGRSLNDLSTDIGDLKTTVEGLRGETSKHAKDMEGLRGEVGKQGKEVESLRGEVGKQGKEVESLRGEVGKQGKEVESLRGEVAGSVREAAAAVERAREGASVGERLDGRVKEVEGSVADIKAAWKAAKSDMRAMKGVVDGLEKRAGEVEKRTAGMADAVHSAREMSQVVMKLSGRVDAAEASAEAAGGRATRAEQGVRAVETALASLRGKVEEASRLCRDMERLGLDEMRPSIAEATARADAAREAAEEAMEAAAAATRLMESFRQEQADAVKVIQAETTAKITRSFSNKIGAIEARLASVEPRSETFADERRSGAAEESATAPVAGQGRSPARPAGASPGKSSSKPFITRMDTMDDMDAEEQ